MTVMNEEVYDALKSVGVDDEKARRAARSFMEGEGRLYRLEAAIGELRGEGNQFRAEVSGKFTLLYWMMGFVLAFMAAILMKLMV